MKYIWCWCWLLLALPAVCDEYGEFVQKWQKQCREQREFCSKWQREFELLSEKIGMLASSGNVADEELRILRNKLQSARENLLLAIVRFEYAFPQKSPERKIPKYTLPNYEAGIRSLQKALSEYQVASDMCQVMDKTVPETPRQETAEEDRNTTEPTSETAPVVPKSMPAPPVREDGEQKGRVAGASPRTNLPDRFATAWARQVREDCRYILAHIIEPFARTAARNSKHTWTDPLPDGKQEETGKNVADPFE